MHLRYPRVYFESPKDINSLQLLALWSESELNLILEVNGFQTKPDRAKEVAALRWVKAVNHHSGFGLWDLAVRGGPRSVATVG
jgi:hypothetical protein